MKSFDLSLYLLMNEPSIRASFINNQKQQENISTNVKKEEKYHVQKRICNYRRYKIPAKTKKAAI